MDKTIWLVVSFVIGFAVLAILATVATGIPDTTTGFFEGMMEEII
jgi:hypothetical protein